MIAAAAQVADPLQLDLALEPGPPSATPPPCPCCHGRRVLQGAWGWQGCTWCDESGIDPESIAVRRPARPSLARAPELLAS